MKRKFSKKLISVLLCLALLISYIPTAIVASADEVVADRVVDNSTMDDWKTFFGPDIVSTENAGGVWVDKSVFTDASKFPSSVKMTDPDNNFLVALSAIASNKEIIGYSTIPTDTMLVLDVSGSMSGSVAELVSATNMAINTLLANNNNNRIGVILYSGSGQQGSSTYAQGVSVLLPLDRYTTADDDVYITRSGSSIAVDNSVRNSKNQSVAASKSVTGGTYIQAGLWEAWEQFSAADTVIESANLQGGQKRMPILVLMSDGAPTVANHHFDSVAEYEVVGRNGRVTTSTSSTIGNGTATNDTIGFLTQLTASYVINRIENHYGHDNGSLFYSLGLGVTETTGNASVATSILDPANSTNGINTYWNEYLELDNETALQLNNSASIYKNSYATVQNYIDNDFYADNTAELESAFRSIVDEIILQSRYYPTAIEGSTPDLSGYITFEDKIGEYMEVKDVKGFVLHDTLFSGLHFAQKLNDSTENGLGSVTNPSSLGYEFVDSVKARLGITENTEVFALLEKAYQYGQLKYVNDNDFSAYIGWYAKADGTYAGFYNEGTTTAPADAVYAVKSYGFLGEASGNIKESDMMYMSVRIAEDLKTGMQTVHWKIPAALVPLVTYNVTLEGTSIQNATNVNVTVTENQPMRLVYEVGLVDTVNSLNVAQITDEKHVASDGSRVFWSNYWDISAAEHIDHVTTTAAFTPSVQNERYYYINNTVVYVKNGNDYVPLSDRNHNIDVNGEYYHGLYVFKNNATKTPEIVYERVSKETLTLLKENNWYDAAYQIDANNSGAWIIPAGTVYQLIADGYYREKVDASGNFYNPTESAKFSNFPYVTLTSTTSEADAKLGNNGRLRLTPATGIKLSKTIDVVDPAASDTFTFRLSLTDVNGAALTGTYPVVTAALNETTGTNSEITLVNGAADITIKANQSVYVTDIPSGARYRLEELDTNGDYKVKTVHIDGISVAGNVAAGIVENQKISAVDFLNTPLTEGNLVIRKEVIHPYGNDYEIPTNIAFQATVKLEKNGVAVANETYNLVTAAGTSQITTNAYGEFTVSIKPGEAIAIEGIEEGTGYIVTETEVADDGFILNSAQSTALSGVMTDESVEAKIVNEYKAAPVSPEDNEIVLRFTKDFTGRDWKDNDVFEFVIERMNTVTHEEATTLATVSVNKNAKVATFDITAEIFESVGTYHFRVYEKSAATPNGITYDTEYRRFTVTVTDTDMDGKLEIAGVDNYLGMTVTEANGNFTVASDFKNTYEAYLGTSVTIPVKKLVRDNLFQLSGFRFALFDENDNYVVSSTLTDANGNAHFSLAYPANALGQHTYKVRELETGIAGMTDSTEEYTVTITVTDNGDGTTSAAVTDMSNTSGAVNELTFTNVYDPTGAAVVFSGQKQLTGNTRVLNRGEFSFSLYETDSTYTVAGQPVETVATAADGGFIFTAVTYDAYDAGETYYYVIKENSGNLGGITYDTTEYKIAVTVTDNGDGTLSAATVINGGAANSIVFTNGYNPTDAVVTLSGSKILTGRNIKDGEFSFTLSEKDGSPLETVANTGSVYSFTPLTITSAGVYEYTIKEEIGQESGVTYDTSVYDVTITVTDDAAGALHYTVAYAKNGVPANAPVYRNSYTPAPTNIVISGEKSLAGRSFEDNEFSFRLIRALSGETIEVVSNTGDEFTFAPRTISAAGTYHYQLVEVDTGLGGVNYDTSIYDIYVTVEDNQNGNLVETARVITKNGVDYTGVPTFANVYTVSDTEFTISGKKNLEGRDLEEGEFTFELYYADMVSGRLVKKGNPVAEAKNDADGNVSFSITYGEAGIFYYVVAEKEENKGGVTYDANEYGIVTNVYDSGKGFWTVETEMLHDSQGDVEAIVFNNSYAPAPTELIIVGTKVLNGRTLLDEEFTFNLYETDSTYTISGTPLDTTKNAGDGKFAFAGIAVNGVGTRYFVVAEDSSAAAENITYDDTVYRIKVTIIDDLDGNLVIDTDIATTQKGGIEAILFTNTYTEPAVVPPPSQPEIPVTGDATNISLWFALIFVSGGVSALTFRKRKQK